MSEVELINSHVRIDRESYDTAKQVAEEYGLSFAQIVRLALADNLDKLARSKTYIDAKQGEEIKAEIHEIFNILESITLNLSRLGNNTNQIARFFNMMKHHDEYIRKNGNYNPTAMYQLEDLIKLFKEIDAYYNKDEFDSLFEKFRETSTNISETLSEFL